LLIGQPGFVTRYTGYQDDTNSYRMQYYTNNADIAKDDLTSIIKKIKLTVVGGSNQPVSVFWAYDFSANYQSETVAIPAQGVSEYGIAQYGANATPVAQYASGISLQELIAYGNGAGKIVQTGFEVDIDGFPISFQKIEIQAKTGKLT
jgi:hypothetical protein